MNCFSLKVSTKFCVKRKRKQGGEIHFNAGRVSHVLARALWTHAQDLGLSQAKLPNGPVNHMQRHEEAYAGPCQFMPP